MDRLDAEAGRIIAYFGYGSLVCRATHRTQIIDAVPARLSGWRRHWRARPDMPGFPAALLTVKKQEASACDGLVVFDDARNLPAIDAREARYRRIEISWDDLSAPVGWPHDCPVYLYVADEHVPLHRDPPKILRSYLDAVMMGFHDEHGEAGLTRFIDETDGFEIGFHEDRDAPLYPRAVTLEQNRLDLYDALSLAPAAIEG